MRDDHTSDDYDRRRDDHVPRHAARHAKGNGNGRSADGGRRTPGWLVPVLLGVVAVAAVVGAFLLDGHDTAAAMGSQSPTTPVLSARRAPEVLAAPVADRRLTADLEQWIAQSPSSTCLVVESGDRTLYAHNGDMPLAGASNQKLVTATAMLLAVGPDARLQTAVQAEAAPSGGVIAGDLYVVGGGDPLLASPAYQQRLANQFEPRLLIDPAQLVDAIVDAGITQIQGSVVGDGSRFDAERYHPTWPDRFHGTEVGPVGPLTINDGLTNLDATAPPASGDDPALGAVTTLTQLLQQRGVTVGGAPRTGDAPEGAVEITTFDSPTVREMVAEMLSDSDDQTAEMLFKEVGHQQSGTGSWEAAAVAATQLLQDAGVTLDGVEIVDGSGLSTDNRLTCQLLTDLLTRPETGPVLVEGLAVAGESGTLHDRWAGTQVEGRLRAKTGTLNQVTSLSGLVTPLQGGSLTFSYVANVAEPAYIDAATLALQESLGEILVGYPRGVDLSVLLPAPPGGADAAG
jgi:serine-type D-Ala-D-Ala carboxypeptidase/endopeptidase (penicillin-binding protein 4)